MFKKFGLNYQNLLLENGSEVRLLQRTGAPIHLQACIHAGSRHNTIPGLAHFLEHILVAGTHSYPSKLALANAIEQVGGSFEATTDNDLIRVTISIPHADHVSLGVTILNEILTASLFSEDVFKNEQSVILNEQKDRGQNVMHLLQDSLLSLMYSDFELHYKGLGTAESVSNMQLIDVITFATDNITSDRTTYIVSGDVEMDTVKDSLNKIKLPQGLNEGKTQLFSSKENNRMVYYNRPGERADLSIGFRCDTNNLEELAGLILIQQMFMGRSSRFINELRYKKGLVYGGKTLFWDFNGTGIFSISTSCAPGNVIEVCDIINNVIAAIASEGITEAECVSLKIKTESHYRFNLQTSKQWTDAEAAAVRHNVEGKTNSNALTILSYIEQMDADSLTEVYRKFFDTNNAYRVVLGLLSDETVEYIQTYISK